MRTELLKNYSTFSLASMALGKDDDKRRTSLGICNPVFAISGDDLQDNENQNQSHQSSIKRFPRKLVGKCCNRKTVEKSFPICKWAPKYNLEKGVADMIAGITVAITMLPQALAYATISDLSPEVGLWSCFIGCFVHCFFGSAPQVIVGPTAILAILANSYTADLDRQCVVMLTLLTGVVTFTLGIFRLGFIVNFISKPVSSAFTSAAALTICSTQIKEAMGLSFTSQGFVNVLIATAGHIKDTKLPDFYLSIGCIGVLVFFRHLPQLISCCGFKINPVLKFVSIARNALVVISTTAFVYAFSDTQPFTLVHEIKAGLPPFAPPPMSVYSPSKNTTFYFVTDILERQSSAIIVLPLLALMEHISVAKALAGDEILDASQEMVSTGLSNILGSFFSNMPITGSFSLTTVNSASGARTPASAFIAGCLVLLAIQFLASFFSYIPKSSLAAVIICAVIYMVDLGVICSMWTSKKLELIPWLITSLISLFVGLELGMMSGFLISVTYLLYYAARPGVKVERGFTTNGTEFVLVQLDRSLTFPSIEYIRYILIKASTSCGPSKLPLVIDCHHIQFVDFTAAQGLTDLIHLFKKRDQMILLWKVKDSVFRVIQRVEADAHVIANESELEATLDSRTRLDSCGIQIQISNPT